MKIEKIVENNHDFFPLTSEKLCLLFRVWDIRKMLYVVPNDFLKFSIQDHWCKETRLMTELLYMCRKTLCSTISMHYHVVMCFLTWMSAATDYGHPMKAQIKEIWNFGPMWQTKYASAVPINLGLGFDFRPGSEDDFFTVCP